MRLQLSRGHRAAAAALACTLAWASPCAAQFDADDHAGDYLLRFFNGSDHVTVRSSIGQYALSLRKDMGLSMHWNNEKVTVPAISAPVGSQEAVDAITTASRPIAGNAYQDFVKVRNEFQTALNDGPAELEYYVSKEEDYLGQQVTANVNRDVHDQRLNLAVGTSYGWDAIAPLADDDTQTGDAHKTTLHGNLVATQIVSPTTLVRVGLEYNLVDGLQHNPYRNVYAGGTNVPERHPDHRLRRDEFLKVNQYLTNRSSLKFGYRHYSDDWGIRSHELSGNLNQYITQAVVAGYEYRYYTQTAADFYRAEYTSVDGIGGYLTGDYRMGALSSHLFGANVHVDLGPMAAGSRLLRHMAVWMNYQRYFNSNNYTANILESSLHVRF